MPIGDRLGALEVSASGRRGFGALASVFDEFVALFKPTGLAARQGYEFMARAMMAYDKYLGGTVYRGSSTPPAKLGYNGDFYLRIQIIADADEDPSDANTDPTYIINLYGPKTDSGWGTPVPIASNAAVVEATSQFAWHQLIDIVPASLSNTAFGTNGTGVSFGGVLWVPQAVSGGTAKGTINNVASTGLQFVHGGSSSSMNGGPTALRLLLDLRRLGPLYDMLEGAFRVRVHVTMSPLATNFQFFYAGLTPVAADGFQVLGGIGYNSGDGGQVTLGLTQAGGVSPDYFLNPAARGSNDVIEYRFHPPFGASLYFGQYASGWPLIAQPQGGIMRMQSSDISQDAWVQQRDTTLGAGAGNFGLQLVLAAATNAASAGFTATVTRITIDQRIITDV